MKVLQVCIAKGRYVPLTLFLFAVYAIANLFCRAIDMLARDVARRVDGL